MKKTLYYIVYIVFLAYQMTMIYNKTNSVIEVEWKGFKAIYYLLLLAASMAFCILSRQRGKIPLFGKTFLLFYGYVLFISIYHAISHPSPDMGPTVILEGCLPVALFFVSFMAQQDEKMVKTTKPILLFFFLAFTYGLVNGYNMQTTFLQVEFVEQNNSYVFLFILPYIALINHQDKKLKFYIIATVVAVVVSMKRGGILGILSGLTVYFYITQSADNRTKSSAFRNTVFIIASFFILYFLINSIMGGIVSGRFYTISETGGSGRDFIWLETTNVISSSNFTEKIFGHGWNTVKYETTWGVGAHNDYLETIFDFGWLGFVLFILFVVSTMFFLFRNQRLYFAAPLGLAVFSYMTVAFVCHIIPQTEYFALFSLAIGGASGAYAMHNKRQQIIVQSKIIEPKSSLYT